MLKPDERVGKSVILVGKKAQKGKHIHFVAVKKLTKCSDLSFVHFFNDSALTAVKRDTNGTCILGIWKGYHLSIECI